MSNKQFLQTLYDTTRELGLVNSQYEFGHLCGRNDSWLSCAKAVDRKMPIAALVCLAVNIQRLPTDGIPRKSRPHVKRLVGSLWTLIEAKGVTEAD